jgi:amino acid adenylation domain-containing protein
MTEQHPVADIYPLAPMQVGILYESLRDSQAYAGQWRCVLRGPLDTAAFAAAWQAVVDRHTALRTGFDWEHRAEPFQFVLRHAAVSLEQLDLRRLSPDGPRERAVAEYLAADGARGFDFRRPPLLRLSLLRLEDDRHLFVWTRHHLSFDGWSLSNLLREVWEIYAARLAGRGPRLAAAAPYRAFVEWLRRQDEERNAAFWRRELAGFEPRAPIGPVGDPGPRQMAERSAVLPPAVTASLIRFARASELTLSTVVQGAWATWLECAQGGGEVVFGVTHSGRSPDLAGSENLIGLLISTLPLRVEPRRERPLIPWLRVLQRRALAALEHVPGSAASLTEWAGLAPGDSLFETVLIYQNYPLQGALDNLPDGLEILEISDRSLPHLPLSLGAEPGPAGSDAGLTLRAFYDARRFGEVAVARLLGQLQSWLTGAAAGEENPDLLGAAERHQILREWNDTGGGPADLLMPDWLERWAVETPDRIALVSGDDDGEWTWDELARRVRQLARVLLESGAGPGERVGVCLERSPEAVIAPLALFQIGATYIPLDPSQPAARMEMQAVDAGLRLLIGRRRVSVPAGSPVQVPGMTWFDLDEKADRIRAASTDPLPRLAGPEDLAYVIFTSGSTGRPKGVMVTHRSLAAFMVARLEVHGRPEPRWMLLMPFHFDGSFTTMSDVLVNGGVLRLPPPGIEQDPARILQEIAAGRITHMAFLPALYSLLLERGPESLATMRFCLVAAEPCPPDLVRRHFELLPRAELINEYGPTEATVWSSWHRLEPGSARDEIVPVGRPIPRSRLYVLDGLLRPVPPGAAGEVAIGGGIVAVGYRGQPAATAERFVPDPFSGAPGARLYRTGDLGRFREDGAAELLGRTDDQVKIRGHRAEPGEIERVLATHPGLSEAAVIPWTEPGTPLRLVAYVAAPAGRNPPPGVDLRRFLAGRLPVYLIPDLFVPLSALPRSATGKLDRRALPRPDFGSVAAEPPVGETETRLCRIWSEVFQPRPVGRSDDFFALGGNSLAAMQVIAGVRSVFGVSLQIRQLFDAPTVAGLAAVLEARPREVEATGGASGAVSAPPRRIRLAELARRGTGT